MSSRDEQSNEIYPKLKAPQADDWKFRISYTNVAILLYHHLAGFYGLYLCFKCHWATIILGIILLEAGMLGLMAGAHRLWAHRSYKAKLPLQIILIIFHSIANQYTAYNWARDHRMHHKYSDTDGDPHNATRGFFFSHVGWLLVQKHPEVHRRGARIDMADILRNPVVMFQKKYKVPFITLLAYVIPTILPMYFWNETLTNAWHINLLRMVLCLNFTSLINSAAHAYGTRPYDKDVRATENMTVNLATLGEGFHNYHHVFPWDYRAEELGRRLNATRAFIELFARIGWAYGLKTAEQGTVVRRSKKCGDGSYVEQMSGNTDLVNE